MAAQRRSANEEWAAAAKAAGRDRAPGELREARAAFKSLTRAEQMQLAEEIAEARGHDFVHSFANVVAVHAGVRRRRDRSGRERLGVTPCVIFLVRTKWPEPGHGRPSQRLPAELMAHASIDGRRRLCAIPTDVQRSLPLATVRDQALSAVQVPVQAGSGMATGTLAWPVRVAGQMLAVLAPLHVMSPLPDLQRGGRRFGAEGRPFDGQGHPQSGPPLFTTLDAGGRLLPWPAPSFDAQLAAVNDVAALRNAFQGFRISPTRPILRSAGEILQASAGAGLRILVPDNHPALGVARGPLQATYSRNITRETPLNYRVAGGLTAYVSHRLLIELQILSGNPTLDGDSGSAVVTPAPDGFTLAGMHIAGNSDLGLSFMLPAWQLFDPLFYQSIPEGAIEPVSV